jgi:hypothetical protein
MGIDPRIGPAEIIFGRHSLLMKTILFAILLCLAPLASGTQLRIVSVVQPLYLLGTESETVIDFQRVMFVTSYSDPEWRFGAISTPFIPPSDGSWKKPHDVNLASLYKISVEGLFKENNQDMVVTIDASKAVRPEDYPFTIEEVIDAITTCVKMMYPVKPAEDGKFEIKVIRPAAKKPAAKK